LEKELVSIFGKGPKRHWLDLLESAGVSAMENVAIPDYRNDPHVRKAGLITTRDHPGCGLADHLGITASLSTTPMRLGRPSPVLGADTEEILREAGYTSSEIDDLKAARVAVQVET